MLGHTGSTGADSGGSDLAELPALEPALRALRRKHNVPGVQLAVHCGGRTATFQAGELEYGTRRAMGPDSGVPIGSITKSFTATVAMILVADGDLELDAPVGEYLSEAADIEEATLRQVLSHTGGLVSDPDSQTATDSLGRYVAAHCRASSQLVPPGTAFSYSNLGYVLTGRLIEAITGMSWWEATEAILLRPLGIDTGFVCEPGAARPRRPVAAGHSVNAAAGRVRPVEQSLPPALAPAGALAVSAQDLVALGLMHAGQGAAGLLPPEYAEQMREPVPEAEPFGLADGWGLGLAVFDENGTAWVGHDGNADGTSCHFRVEPASGTVVAFTSNANTGRAVWDELRGELAGAGLPFAPGEPERRAEEPDAVLVAAAARAGAPETPPGAETAPPPPVDCAGSYVNGSVELVVTASREGLLLSVDGDPPSRIACDDRLSFALADPGSTQHLLGGRFVREEDTGSVVGIQLGGRLARRVGAANPPRPGQSAARAPAVTCSPP
jgi:CubicO group peptidase (beta-lactamase class C family)